MSSASRMGQLFDVARFARERLRFNPNPVQIQVLSPEHQRGILNCSRQWGKSTLTAIKAVHRAEFVAKSLVLVVSPCERQSAEFVRKASEFVSELGHVLRGDGDNRTSLLFPNGSRIVGLPGSEETIRGFSNVSMLLIDEASLVPDALFDAVTPMLAVSDGDLWIMSTPRGKQGFFYNEWQNGSADWLRVRGTVESATHIRPTFLAEEKRRKSDAIFRQEYECEFVAIDGALFDEAALRRMVTDEFKPLVHV